MDRPFAAEISRDPARSNYHGTAWHGSIASIADDATPLQRHQQNVEQVRPDTRKEGLEYLGDIYRSWLTVDLKSLTFAVRSTVAPPLVLFVYIVVVL